MISHRARTHITLSATSHAELGATRGAALALTLPAAMEWYERLFRTIGVNETVQNEAVERTLETLSAWAPEFIEELAGIGRSGNLTLEQVVALNARTEVLSLAPRAVKECSTVAAEIHGARMGVQTWDWHVELAEFWHTQEVNGPGLRYAGLTEQGIISKIGLNEAGLALHFNILGHTEDRPGGVPMHLLSAKVLSSCGSISEALDLIRSAPVTSSSAFTLAERDRAVSVEITPVGVFVIEEREGSVQRTNHFQDARPLAGQRNEAYEPDSSQRLELIRNRLTERSPRDERELVELLVSGEGEPPLCCVPDPSGAFGDRWATLATVVTNPAERVIRVLDGMPSDARTRSWSEFRL